MVGSPCAVPFLESPGPRLVPAVPSLEPEAEIFVTASSSMASLLFLPLLFQTESQAAVRANLHDPACAQPLNILNVA